MILKSPYISGSLTVTGNATIQGSISGTITGSATSASYAQTASSIANLNQNVQITGSLTTNGTITAQTLVVQTVTSSVVYSSGSNIFGNSQSNIQQMTGSVLISGSAGIGTSSSGASLYVNKNQNSATTINFSNNSTGNAVQTNFQLGNASGSNVSGLTLFGGGFTNNGLYLADGLYMYNNRAKGGITIATEQLTDIVLATNATERWRLSSTGGVVQKTGSYTIDSGVSGIAGIFITPEGNNSNSGFTNIQTFYGSVGYTAPLVLNRYGGNVGIGITQPSDRLVVSGAVSFVAAIGVTSSPAAIYNSTNGWFYIQGNSASGSLLYADQNRNTSVRVVSDGTIQFHNSGEKARFDSSGNLGIGTTTPAVSLQVNGIIYAQKQGGTNSTPAIQVRAAGGGPRIQTYGLDADSRAWMGLGTDMAGNPYEHSLYFSAPDNQPSYGRQTFGSYDGTTYGLKMTILRDGSIGAPTGTNIYNPSDIRLKQNVTTITAGLDKVMGLNPVKFNWIENFSPDEQGKAMLGFIAQEVESIIPEAVEGFSDGSSIIVGETTVENPLRVNEKFIIPVLVKAIQELKAENDTLKERLTALENK